MHAIDTSLLYALFNAGDAWHEEAKRLMDTHRPILVPPGILQETLDLIRLRHGGKTASEALAWLRAQPQVVLEPVRGDRSHQSAVQAYAGARQGPLHAMKSSFADVWCVAHAAEHAAALLTKDEGQRRLHKAWTA